MRQRDDLIRGMGKENQIVVLLVGLCPAAAVSVHVIDALWMSVGVLFVLVLSAVAMTLLARWGGPAEGEPRAGASAARWLGALGISSGLTASFEIVLLALSPQASTALGIYAPLIAVNCLVLGRIDAYSRGRSLVGSTLDAVGNGLGFAAFLVLIALVREVFGAGTITLFPVGGFSGVLPVPGLVDDPARALGFAGGGLLCIGYLAGAAQAVRRRRERRDASRGEQA
jgi:Na+-translocating ferredoxin:NAD+ oxidoreductase subunit E